MMEPDTIATPTELIHKLYQADVPLDGAPLMKIARTTVNAPESTVMLEWKTPPQE
jgi:hypothetical protein